MDLLTSHRFTDWATGCDTMAARIGEGGKVRADSRRDPEANHIAFEVTTPMVNPAVRVHKERMAAIAQNSSEVQEFKVTLRWFRPGQCLAALCQSAYLLMFKYFGYDFVSNSRYNFIRDQVVRRDGGR